MRFLISMLVVVTTAGLILVGCNSTEHLGKTASTPTATPMTTAPADNVRRITTVELRDLVEKNEAFIVDVRNEASYNAGHIRGAKLIPVAEVMNHLKEFPKDKLIVTYCS